MLLKYLSIKDGLKRISIKLLIFLAVLLKYLSIKDGLKQISHNSPVMPLAHF